MTAAFLRLSVRSGRSLQGLVLGVVGGGHVGKKVIAKAGALGMTVLVNDPPREAEEGPGQFSALEQLRQEADFISFHVPMHREGPYRSVHLADAAFLAGMKDTAVLYNTSRGAVVDTGALRDALRRRDIGGAVLDVWEGEPDIDQELLALTDIATPHIAGYSADGKALGTAMSVQQISRFFGLGLDGWHPAELPRPGSMHIELQGRGAEGISDAVEQTYDILADDRCLRDDPRGFERQRDRHPVRREFGAYTVSADDAALLDTLSALGFKS
jgi:erythronate-4-phosphate dehydrogenase